MKTSQRITKMKYFRLMKKINYSEILKKLQNSLGGVEKSSFLKKCKIFLIYKESERLWVPQKNEKFSTYYKYEIFWCPEEDIESWDSQRAENCPEGNEKFWFLKKYKTFSTYKEVGRLWAP